MVGIHYEVYFGQEDSDSDRCAFYFVYGASHKEAKAWGDKISWDYVHADRPTSRALTSLKSTPVADYLFTEFGHAPLDFEEIRNWEKQTPLDDLRQFGMGSSGRVGGDQMESRSHTDECPRTLKELRDQLEKLYPIGSRDHELIVLGKNWDPNQQAYYIFTVLDATGENWSEAVLCRAANFYHACMVWATQEKLATGAVRCAGVQLAMGFHPVGHSPFHRLPGG